VCARLARRGLVALYSAARVTPEWRKQDRGSGLGGLAEKERESQRGRGAMWWFGAVRCRRGCARSEPAARRQRRCTRRPGGLPATPRGRGSAEPMAGWGRVVGGRCGPGRERDLRLCDGGWISGSPVLQRARRTADENGMYVPLPSSSYPGRSFLDSSFSLECTSWS